MSDVVLSNVDQVIGYASAARTGAVAESAAELTTAIDALQAAASGATAYRDDEAFTSSQIAAAAGTGGILRIYGNKVWKVTKPSPGNIPPMGLGDGSEADHDLLVSRVIGEARYYNCEGGRGGVIRTVTTLADDPGGTTVGSLRYHLNAHAAWSGMNRANASKIVFDPTLEPADPARATISLTADLIVCPFGASQLTIDAAAFQRGLDLNPGGRPGPIPYGYIKTGNALTAQTGTFTIVLDSTTANFGGAKLEAGELIAIHAEDGSGNITSTYAAGLVVNSFVQNASTGTYTINVTGTVNGGGAPVGAMVLMNGNPGQQVTYSAGVPGHGVNVTGLNFNDTFGFAFGRVVTTAVTATTGAQSRTMTLDTSALWTNNTGYQLLVGTKLDAYTLSAGQKTLYNNGAMTVTALNSGTKSVTVTADLATGIPVGATIIWQNATNDGYWSRSIIIRNVRYNGNWGGDTVDTGNRQDFTIRNWCTGVLLDHCEWTNPSPFHDVMINIGTGARGITVRDSHPNRHYKAINHFHGIDGTGGIDPFTEIQGTPHAWPPGYSISNPGDFDFRIPTAGLHGNSQGLEVTVTTATWTGNWFDTLGQRGPKADLFAHVHFYNNLATDWGVHNDTLKQVPIQFPLPGGVAATGGVSTELVGYAFALLENNRYLPRTGSSGGALRPVKHDGNPPQTKPAYVRTRGNYYDPACVLQTDDPTDEWVFSARYSYDLQPPDASMETWIRTNAGSGTSSSMWTFVGNPQPHSQVGVTDHGAQVGPGGIPASASALDLQGPLTSGSYNASTGVFTITVQALKPRAKITSNPTNIAFAAGEIAEWDTTGASTTTFGAGTLPNAPADGTLVAVKLSGTATVSSTVVGVNVNTQGIDVFSGTGTQRQLTFAGDGRLFSYRAVDHTWLTVANDMPLAEVQALIAAATSPAASTLLQVGTSTARLAATTATISTGVRWWESDTGNEYSAAVSGGTITWTMIASINGAELCTPVTYHPTSAQSPDATTTSLVDIAASAVTAGWTGITGTSFDQAFVFPPSGRATVEVSGFAKGSGASTIVRMSLYDVLGSAAITNTTAPVLTGNTQQPVIYKKTITGTPGAAGSVRPQWTISSGTATLSVGANNGPFRVRVTAAA